MAVCLKSDRLHIDGQASAPTDSNIEPGDVYYNTTDDTLYRRDQNNEWVAVGGGAIIISNTEPDVSRGVLDSGKLWFDTGTSGALLVWDGYSWIQILDPEASNRAIASATAPSNPVTGDTWFDLPNGNLYVWNGSWVQLSRSPSIYDELKDMTDVSGATGTAAGKILQSNGNSSFSFVPATLDVVELTDITNAATATAGQVLQVNSNNSTYTFVTPAENLGDMSNVSAAGNNNNSLNKIFARTGNSQYGFITHEHALGDLTDVEVPADTAAANADENEYVLTADGDGTYSFQQLTGALATYGPNPPADPSVGELWFDNDDSDAAGLYVYDGNAWIRSTGQAEAIETTLLDISALAATSINGITALQEIRTSDYISDGEAIEIPADVYIWSNDINVPALIIDTPNAIVINNGKIIGRGGNANGGSAGPAISIEAEGVQIKNKAGAFIAGGGGGGQFVTTNLGRAQSAGGGGGAGGGTGSRGSGNANSSFIAGGAVGQTGGGGAQAGAAGGTGNDSGGSGGGRILPGTSHGSGGGAGGSAGSNVNSLTAGGGGGWGAKGGDNGLRLGGQGGAAIIGSKIWGGIDNAGTTYGHVAPAMGASRNSNNIQNSKEISLSSLGVAPGSTFTIPANYWVWSDNTSVAALTIDVANVTVVNNGNIIGRGGNAGYNAGSPGGPAINVTASGVTITNTSTGFIGGGGGGGGAGVINSNRGQFGGGGGGAGGGFGAYGGSNPRGSGEVIAGGLINQRGSPLRSSGSDVGGAGSTSGPGSGGGRIVPGNGNAGYGDGTGAANGGGWGAAGGTGRGNRPGGAGGAAISGVAVTLTNSGTIYGST
jgi:hypothetical protein